MKKFLLTVFEKGIIIPVFTVAIIAAAVVDDIKWEIDQRF